MANTHYAIAGSFPSDIRVIACGSKAFCEVAIEQHVAGNNLNPDTFETVELLERDPSVVFVPDNDEEHDKDYYRAEIEAMKQTIIGWTTPV